MISHQVISSTKVSLVVYCLFGLLIFSAFSPLKASECQKSFGLIDPSKDFSSASINGDLKRPEEDLPNFLLTGNGGGYSTARSDDTFTHEYIGFSLSGQAPGPSMDIGCSYGIADRQILKCGGSVIGVDHAISDMEIFFSELTIAERGKLRLFYGYFPAQPQISNGSLGAILASRVFHFMRPDEIEASFKRAFELLAPGGKLFVTSETAFHRKSKESGFMEEYLDRVERGEPWPGVLEDANRVYGPSYNLPKYMHYMNESVFRREAEKAGFIVERTHTFPRPNFPTAVQLDGRESVGLVARKP